MTDKQEFIENVKKLGFKFGEREIDGASPGIYFQRNGTLVAYWSEAAGGKVFAKPSNRWSTSGRKFTKVKLEDI